MMEGMSTFQHRKLHSRLTKRRGALKLPVFGETLLENPEDPEACSSNNSAASSESDFSAWRDRRGAVVGPGSQAPEAGVGSRRQSCPAISRLASITPGSPTTGADSTIEWTIPKLSKRGRRNSDVHVHVSQLGGAEMYPASPPARAAADRFPPDIKPDFVTSLRSRVGSLMQVLRIKKRRPGNRRRSVVSQDELLPVEHVEVTALDLILEQAMEGPLQNLSWRLNVKGVIEGIFTCELPLLELESGDITMRIRDNRLIFMTESGEGDFSIPVPRGYIVLPDFVDASTLHFKLTEREEALVIRGMVKGEETRRRFSSRRQSSQRNLPSAASFNTEQDTE